MEPPFFHATSFLGAGSFGECFAVDAASTGAMLSPTAALQSRRLVVKLTRVCGTLRDGGGIAGLQRRLAPAAADAAPAADVAEVWLPSTTPLGREHEALAQLSRAVSFADIDELLLTGSDAAVLALTPLVPQRHSAFLTVSGLSSINWQEADSARGSIGCVLATEQFGCSLLQAVFENPAYFGQERHRGCPPPPSPI